MFCPSLASKNERKAAKPNVTSVATLTPLNRKTLMCGLTCALNHIQASVQTTASRTALTTNRLPYFCCHVVGSGMIVLGNPLIG